MKIGELIKATRKEKRITQSDLASAIGVERSTIAKYESGISEPSIDTIKKISRALDRDLLSALGETNDSTEINEAISYAQNQLSKANYENMQIMTLLANGDNSLHTVIVNDLTSDEINELQAFINYLEYKRHSIEVKKD